MNYDGRAVAHLNDKVAEMSCNQISGALYSAGLAFCMQQRLTSLIQLTLGLSKKDATNDLTVESPDLQPGRAGFDSASSSDS